MHVIEIIEKKRDQKSLSKKEINYFIRAYLDGFIPDYQMSAFLMAVYLNGMDEEETSLLTDAMLHSGKILAHKKSSRALVDKHSTGGVGDKISIPLAPAVAACGLRVPMISGRGLGHTGGTLDKLESIPGFRTDLSIEELEAQIEDIGCVIMSQTKDIAPADKMLYALRDVTATVGSIPLIASSIMSKKLAEGLDALVLDVKFGSGAFMNRLEQAENLATLMVAIGARMGKKVTALLTNMDQPLGSMIGNALEIKESIDLLRGQGPEDSAFLTTEIGAEMLFLANMVTTLEEGRCKINEVLQNGRAFDIFVRMVKAQGGDIQYVLEPARFKEAEQKIAVEALDSGYINSIDCRALGLAVSVLGGGRFTLDDEINPRVGLELKIKIGEPVFKGQTLGVIHADKQGADEALLRVKNAIRITKEAVDKPLLCQKRISTND